MNLITHIIRYFSNRYQCVWFDRQCLPTEGDSITVGNMTATFYPTKTDETFRNMAIDALDPKHAVDTPLLDSILAPTKTDKQTEV